MIIQILNPQWFKNKNLLYFFYNMSQEIFLINIIKALKNLINEIHKAEESEHEKKLVDTLIIQHNHYKNLLFNLDIFSEIKSNDQDEFTKQMKQTAQLFGNENKIINVNELDPSVFENFGKGIFSQNKMTTTQVIQKQNENISNNIDFKFEIKKNESRS